MVSRSSQPLKQILPDLASICVPFTSILKEDIPWNWTKQQEAAFFVYGIKFQVISDHKTLSSILTPNRSNKTFSSRLMRWVDHLLPFELEVTYAPGRVLGFADYLSRHPSEIKEQQSKRSSCGMTGSS